MFRRLVSPATQFLPRWLLRQLVASFPEQTRVEQLKKVIDAMDKRAGDIYAEKKRGFAKGDVDVVQQVQGGKDIISVLSASLILYHYCCILITCLVRANSAADEKNRLTEEEIVAQMS